MEPMVLAVLAVIAVAVFLLLIKARKNKDAELAEKELAEKPDSYSFTEIQGKTPEQEQVTCPVCGQKQHSRNQTCESCGAFLGNEDSVPCPKCGRFQSASNVRCAVCGADMKGDRMETEEVDYEEMETVEISFQEDLQKPSAPAEKKAEQAPPTAQELAVLQELFTNLRVFVRDANLPEQAAQAYRPGMIFRDEGYADSSAVVAGMTTTHRYMILSNRMHARVYSEKCIVWKHHEAPRRSLFKVLDVHSFQGKTAIILLHMPEEALSVMKKAPTQQEQALLREAVQYFEASCARPPVPEVNDPEWLEFCKDPVGLDLMGQFWQIL